MGNGTDTAQDVNTVDTETLEYTRNLHKLILEWYRNADSKAQILLSLDGVFVAFLTGSIFRKYDDLKDIVPTFNTYTWAALILMCICLVISIICALNCLRSRTYSASALQEMFRELEENKQFDKNNAETYVPEVMGFFQIIAELDAEQFARKLLAVDREFIIHTLGRQIHIISGNVHKKHESVNLGFVLAGLTLILFLAGGAGYLASFLTKFATG